MTHTFSLSVPHRDAGSVGITPPDAQCTLHIQRQAARHQRHRSVMCRLRFILSDGAGGAGLRTRWRSYSAGRSIGDSRLAYQDCITQVLDSPGSKRPEPFRLRQMDLHVGHSGTFFPLPASLGAEVIVRVQRTALWYQLIFTCPMRLGKGRCIGRRLYLT
jgi:hypothetical protein